MIDGEERLIKRSQVLHSAIINDLKQNSSNYDHFKRDLLGGDKLIENVTRLLANDQAKRNAIGGPSIKREKFQANYWRRWANDKNLLEDLSAKEYQVEQQVGKYRLEQRRKSDARRLLAAANQQYQKQSNLRSKKVVVPLLGPRSGPVLDPLQQMEAQQQEEIQRLRGLHDPTVSFLMNVLAASSNNTNTDQNVHQQSDKNVLMKSLAFCSVSPPRHIIGGAWSQSNRLSSSTSSIKVNASSIPVPDTAYAATVHNFNTAQPFACSARFTKTAPDISQAPPPPATTDNDVVSSTNKKELYKGRFASADRFDDHVNSSSASSGPGPAGYAPPRLFDTKQAANNSNQQTNNRNKQRLKSPGPIPSATFFGAGCDLESHVRCGLCYPKNGYNPDGSNHDNHINSHEGCRRRQYFDPTTSAGKRTGGGVMAINQAIANDLLPFMLIQPALPMTALQAAAMSGDLSAIRAIATACSGHLPLDDYSDRISNVMPLKYTALHCAVAMDQPTALQLIVEAFPFAPVAFFQLQDDRGQTALRLAIKQITVACVSILTDDHRCRPTDSDLQACSVKANANCDGGERGDDRHRIWQMVKLCLERNQLLDQLQLSSPSQSGKARSSKVRDNTFTAGI